jgi:hypothetical protein
MKTQSQSWSWNVQVVSFLRLYFHLTSIPGTQSVLLHTIFFYNMYEVGKESKDYFMSTAVHSTLFCHLFDIL